METLLTYLAVYDAYLEGHIPVNFTTMFKTPIFLIPVRILRLRYLRYQQQGNEQTPIQADRGILLLQTCVVPGLQPQYLSEIFPKASCPALILEVTVRPVLGFISTRYHSLSLTGHPYASCHCSCTCFCCCCYCSGCCCCYDFRFAMRRCISFSAAWRSTFSLKSSTSNFSKRDKICTHRINPKDQLDG